MPSGGTAGSYDSFIPSFWIEFLSYFDVWELA